MADGLAGLKFKVNDRARKVGGNYQATGTIRAAFLTRTGEPRYVFDFDEPPGLLHIFNEGQLEPAGKAESMPAQ